MKEKAYSCTLDRLGRTRQDPNVTRDQFGRWLWNRGLSSTHYDLVSVHHFTPLLCAPRSAQPRSPGFSVCTSPITVSRIKRPSDLGGLER